MKKITLLPFIGSLFTGMLVFTSCNPPEEKQVNVDQSVKTAIYDTMKEWYFWNEELPVSVDVDLNQSNEELLRGLMYTELDRWSYLTTTEEFTKAFTGQNAGHGIGFAMGPDEKIYISFVYKDSPAGKDGWERGWEIVGINDRPITSYRTANGYSFQLGPNNSGITNTFTFRLPDGSTTTRTNTKEEYQANSVLHKEVVKEGNKAIGYWAYNSFKASPGISPTKSLEVEETLAYFEEAGINELVMDLRYNGGGSVDVAEDIMNALVPASASGKLMYTNAHNLDKSSYNSETLFEKQGNLSLERVIFITSRGSASASELLINCLEPYMEVVLVGENTYGKPVGSFPLSNFNPTLRENNVELVPVTFAIANADGNAAYYNGFPVDILAMDDPSKNWGDLSEMNFGTAISYLRDGNLAPLARMSPSADRWSMIDNFSGLEKEFPVY